MLAMDFIKANRADVERAIRDKGVDVDLDALLALEAEARALKTEIDNLRASRNAISARFKDAAPEEKAALGAEAKAAGARASELEAELGDKDAALKAMMLKLPGIPWEGAPVGPDESFNTVVRQEGSPPNFTFEPLDHVALIERNDWADLSRITSGLGQPHLLPQGPPRPARDQADGLGAGADRRGRLHPDHRPRHRPRAGLPQPGPVPRPCRGNLCAAQRRRSTSPAPPRSR